MVQNNGQVIKRGDLVSGIKIGGGRICGKYSTKLSANTYTIIADGQTFIVSDIEAVPQNLIKVFEEAARSDASNKKTKLKRSYLEKRLDELLSLDCTDEIANKISFVLTKLGEF